MSHSSINATISALQSKTSHLRAQASAETQSRLAEIDAKRAQANEDESKRAARDARQAPVREGVGQVVDITV
jgi:hypothetical protein